MKKPKDGLTVFILNSLFNGLFHVKAILVEEQLWYYGDKRIHAFTKGISPKVNAIARLQFDLAYLRCHCLVR